MSILTMTYYFASQDPYAMKSSSLAWYMALLPINQSPRSKTSVRGLSWFVVAVWVFPVNGADGKPKSVS